MKTNQPKIYPKDTGTALGAILLACTFLAGPLRAEEAATKGLKPAESSIQGVVTAISPEGQSTPLEGITLKLSCDCLEGQFLLSVTDAEGRYVITQLGEGTYSLEISLEGFEPFTRTVVLRQNETRTENASIP
jgi:hypothetical protein